MLNALLNWLEQVLLRNQDDLFTHPLATPPSIREDYLMAVQGLVDCYFRSRLHTAIGSTNRFNIMCSDRK